MRDDRPPTANELRRFNRALWVPFWFMAFLCAISLFVPLLMGATDIGVSGPAFYCFLPMAFYFMAMIHRSLSERIGRLEARLDSSGNREEAT